MGEDQSSGPPEKRQGRTTCQCLEILEPFPSVDVFGYGQVRLVARANEDQARGLRRRKPKHDPNQQPAEQEVEQADRGDPEERATSPPASRLQSPLGKPPARRREMGAPRVPRRFCRSLISHRHDSTPCRLPPKALFSRSAVTAGAAPERFSVRARRFESQSQPVARDQG